MRISTLLLTILFFFVGTSARAQKHGVIVNMTDGVPVRDVKIYTNRNTVATTNWRGEYSISKPFTSVTITHKDFVSLTLNLYEMGDTIELLPKFHSLDEVVVYGTHKMTFDTKKATSDARDYYTPQVGGFSFDFFSLFSKHGLSSKQREKHDLIIKTY